MKESLSMDSSAASDTHSLRVTFRDVDSAYALFHTFMPDDLDYFTRVARKRDGASHVILLGIPPEHSLSDFLDLCRDHPDVTDVRTITEEEFWRAPSNAI